MGENRTYEKKTLTNVYTQRISTIAGVQSIETDKLDGLVRFHLIRHKSTQIVIQCISWPVRIVQGDPKRLFYCNMSLTNWKRPKQKAIFFYSWVHIRRFKYLAFIYFGPKILSLKKWHIFFRNHCVLAYYTGCQQKWLSNIQHIFCHFWRPQQKNWWHILKSIKKVGNIMLTQN